MAHQEIIKRFVAKIKEKHPSLHEPTIEKDFYLTLLLSEISNDLDEDTKSPFHTLAFKGGTLLARTHLQYHRISEDLDFTHTENRRLGKLSSKQRNKIISNFTHRLAEKLQMLSRKYGLDFSTDKSDPKYCRVFDRKRVYQFKVHYLPAYGAEGIIKCEVNFNDLLIYSTAFESIKHLFDAELLHDLEFIEGIKIKIKKNIACYDLREIALEKMRAVLTRPAIKERDLLDLFLLSKKLDLNALEKNKVIDKILISASLVKGLAVRIEHNMEMLSKHRHHVLEERSQLALIAINEEEYAEFEQRILPLILEIGNESLLKLEKVMPPVKSTKMP